MSYIKIVKAVLLLSLATLFAAPALAQVSSLTASQSGGSVTLNWNSFASTHYIRENGVTVSQTSANTRTLNRAPGSYQYMVASCYYNGEPYCIYSNTVYVTVTAAVPPPPPPPPPLEFTVGSLQQFMALARGEDKTMANLIGDEIETRLRNANLSLDENGLTYSENLPTIQIRSGCSKNYQLRNLQVNASLNNASRFEIVMDSLSKPIVATAQLIGTVEASGQVRVRLGFKVFGECIRYLKASVDGTVRTDFTINASLMIKLNPTRDLDTAPGTLKIRINPQATLTGNMAVTNTSATLTNANLSILGINVFSGVVGNLLEKQILRMANGAISNAISGNLNNISIAVNSAFGQYLQEAQTDINNKLAALPRAYIIPVDGLSNDMLSFVSHYALNYLPPAGFLQANSMELMYLLLVGDDKAISDRVGNSLACNASADLLMLNMNRTPAPVPYRTTTRTDFCANVDNKNWLGNAEPSVAGYTGADSWTLMPSTSFNLNAGVAPINNNYQPYVRRVHYRTIDGITDGMRTVINYTAYGAAMQACYQAGQGYCNNPPNINNYTTYVPIVRGNGSCKLEMRVYKKDVNQTGLKPLMAIHGGSLKYRGQGFSGMEAYISHFTEQGFVVFAPFYRLLSDFDGNTECNKATGEQILTDIDAAMSWVQANKTNYGVAAGERVRLFGQSSGGHLAGWLVTHRQADVQKALLMYAPLDGLDFINNYQAYANSLPYSSEYTTSFSGPAIGLMESFLSPIGGATINLLDVTPSTNSLVLNNSFPYLVSGSPSSYPPVYMVHGRQDPLVPAIQSVRLCNAYTGNAASGPANTAGTASLQAYACGPSRVDLLQEATHALELCLPPLRCEAGSTVAGITAAAQSLATARAWLGQ
jgi:acetyl esterase/lipase